MIETYAKIIRPFGAVVAIDEPADLDLRPLKLKSIAWHWELMFTRALFDPESTAQHEILTRAAELVDKGVLHTTLTTGSTASPPPTCGSAHAAVEHGSVDRQDGPRRILIFVRGFLPWWSVMTLA